MYVFKYFSIIIVITAPDDAVGRPAEGIRFSASAFNGYFAQRVPGLFLAGSFRMCSDCEVLKGICPWRIRHPLCQVHIEPVPKFVHTSGTDRSPLRRHVHESIQTPYIYIYIYIYIAHANYSVRTQWQVVACMHVCVIMHLHGLCG